MAGYYNFSMSNNAKAAYKSGEMPLSKWTKADILSAIKAYIENDTVDFSFENLSKLSVAELKTYALKCVSWHHTSSKYNETNFYALNYTFINNLTDAKIENIISARKPKSAIKSIPMTAIIRYTEWVSRRAYERTEVVHYNSTDKMLQTSCGAKRMSSVCIVYATEGTLSDTAITTALEEKRNAERKAEQDKKNAFLNSMTASARAWYENLNGRFESSSSGNIYAYNRKPMSYNYNNLPAFFIAGEHRIAQKNDRLILQTWNGAEWISEID